MTPTGESGCVAVVGLEAHSVKRSNPRTPVPLPALGGEEHRAFSSSFWSMVEKRGPDDCWPWKGRPLYWKGRPHPRGYGIVYVNGSRCYAHRVAYAIGHGAVPAGVQVLHSCDTPPCMNARHLHLGTHRSNMAEMASRERAAQLRFTGAVIDEMRRRRAVGESLTSIAATFGTSKGYVCALLSDRHGIRRHAPTTMSPIPVRPPVADRVNLELARALLAQGYPVMAVATLMGLSDPSLRYELRRSKGRDRASIRPGPATAAYVAALVGDQASVAPLLQSPPAGLTPTLQPEPGPRILQAIGSWLHRPRTRLTPEQVAELRDRYQRGESLADLSRRFEICRDHVRRVARGVRRPVAPGPVGTRPRQPLAT